MIQPAYPDMAKLARVQGTCIRTRCSIATAKLPGSKIISGNPLRAEAARKAVLHWRYSPTYLHGQAVEVITDIIVMFRLTPPAG